MSSEHPEVCNVLTALYRNDLSLNAHEIGIALYGVQRMGTEAEAAFVVDFLYEQIDKLSKDTDGFKSPLLVSKDLISLTQNLLLVVPLFREGMKTTQEGLDHKQESLDKSIESLSVLGDNLCSRREKLGVADTLESIERLQDSLDDKQEIMHTLQESLDGFQSDLDRCVRWEEINAKILNELSRRKDSNDKSLKPALIAPNTTEKRVYTIAREAFENTSVSIHSKEYLFHFMSDIILKMPYMVNPKEPGVSIYTTYIYISYMNLYI